MNFSHKSSGRLCRSFALVSLLFATGPAPGAAASQPAAASGACSPARLRAEMANIARVTYGPVGAAAQVVESGSVVSLHGQQRLPMQSVYKLPIAMAVLHQVDLGRLRLNQQVRIGPSDLMPPALYSPLRDKYPNGTVMTVSALLGAMILISDNTASDVLMGRVGGPPQVTAYLRGIGIQNMVVATPEREMGQSEQVQYRNWATPDAMLKLLCALQQGRGLSASSRHYLLTLMVRCQTGPRQIKGLLPIGTVVAHKTGSSGTVNGLTRATNDVGLITLPDGKHLAVVVFVSDTRADAATRDKVIAKIARAVWDCRTALEDRK